MKNGTSALKNRRELLRLVGGGAAFLSIAGLSACSDDPSAPSTPKSDSSNPEKPGPEPQAASESAVDPVTAQDESPQAMNEPTAETTPGDSSGIPRLAEDDPQAKALGYRHDTAEVDGANYPNHDASQACRNCALYSGNGGEDWGACGIFPARQVNASGWCSAYNPKT